MARTQDSSVRMIGDEQRAEAIEELRWHHESKRLSEDEMERRIERAHRALTRADIAMLFADLPRHPTVPPGTAYADRIQRARQQRMSAWRVIGWTFAVALAFFVAIGAVLDGWRWAWVIFLVPAFVAVSQRARLTAKPAAASVVH